VPEINPVTETPVRGADPFAFLVKRLDPEYRRRIALLTLIGSKQVTELEFRLRDWLPAEREARPKVPPRSIPSRRHDRSENTAPTRFIRCSPNPIAGVSRSCAHPADILWTVTIIDLPKASCKVVR